MTDPFSYARNIAVTLLNMQPLRTPEVIRAQVKQAASVALAAGLGAVDEEALVAQLMHEGNVHVPDATLMFDPADHIEWLPAKRGSISWQFWSRYQTYLEQDKKLPEPVVSSLGRLTDEILGRLEDPLRAAPWDCRGMVVGSVQSGKTANYSGLICKAIDAGYKLVVVLAGTHNNLRSQTQYRLDEGVLGRDSQKDRSLDRADSLIGVGKLFGQTLPIHTLTTSLEDGDFRAPRADTGVTIGGDPVILVVKKYGSVLANLLKWVLHVRGEETGGGRRIVRGLPFLVIDDEADNASINTKSSRKKGESEVTAINGRIRELLDAFEKSAYVGYTATPFANIFINPDAETPKHGEDLFPRSFILNVSPPSNYVSPARVFGLEGDIDSGIEPAAELPLFSLVADHEEAFPPKHRKDHVVTELPESLIHAIHCFVLSCAARRARGQADVHNSMLVHVTRWVAVQGLVLELIQKEVDSIRRRIKFGEGERKDALLPHLNRVWLSEYIPITARVRLMAQDEELAEVTWEEIVRALPEAVARIEVKEINGHATDALDYVAHTQGLTVIAVGGDKLSRGLTLEGLSVSYFLRTSVMYDTLMQMGRWFGYRPGYLDLCRLFTTDDLRRWYRHIALAEIELRREFDRMKAAGLTPRRYGLRIREHPEGLLITAMNKMSHARTQRLSYAGQLVQTAHFMTNEDVVKSNFAVAGRFIEQLGGAGSAVTVTNARVWTNVSADRVIDGLIREFQVAPEGWRFQKAELIEFIRRQGEIGELTDWTVALVDTDGSVARVPLGGCLVGPAERAPEKGGWDSESIPAVYATQNANIQSPGHQALDLAQIVVSSKIFEELVAKRVILGGGRLFCPEEVEIIRGCRDEGGTLALAAERITAFRKAASSTNGGEKIGSAKINGEVARQVRPGSHGLVLIYLLVPTGKRWPKTREPFVGLAVSFPSSHTAKAVTYSVNKVWQTMLRDGDYEDADAN